MEENNKKFTCNVKGISEEDLNLILSLSNKEKEYIIKVKSGMGIIPNPNLYLSKNITKDDIFNGKDLFNLLDSSLAIGLLYILDKKQYTYYRELKSINRMHWKPIIDRLMNLNILKQINVSEKIHEHLMYKNKLGSYHINKMKYYSFTEEFDGVYENLRDYINNNVEIRFKGFVDKYFEEYDEIQREIQLQEMPHNLRLYELNKEKWSKKQCKEYRDMLNSNPTHKKWMEDNKYKLK